MLQRVRHAAAALCTLCLLAMSTALGKGALLRSSGMLSLATGAPFCLQWAFAYDSLAASGS